MKFKRSQLTISSDDQCFSCPLKSVCPLLDALTEGVVLMAQQSIGVHNCYLFATIQAENLEKQPILKLIQ